MTLLPFQGDLRKQWILGLLLIVSGTVLCWLPFFLHMPLPFITIDTWLYYNVLSVIEQRADMYIGYPQVGYPLFLKCCELILDRAWFVVLMQVLLQVASVCVFYYVYALAFRKHLLLVALVLMGYLTSAMNLGFDSTLTPDSLLSSAFILCSAILLHVLVHQKFSLLPVYSLVMVAALSVRPSAVVLIPPFVALLGYLVWKHGKWAVVTLNAMLLALAMCALCALYYVLPGYGDFSFIAELKEPEWAKKVKVRSIDDPMLLELAGKVPHPEIRKAAAFHALTDLDSIKAGYMTTVFRGVNLRYGLGADSTSFLFQNSEGVTLNLDSVSMALGADSADYTAFRDDFVERYRDTVLDFRAEFGLMYSWLNTPYFFEFFAMDSIVGTPFALKDFYGNMLRLRSEEHYVRDEWQQYGRNDIRTIVKHQVFRRTIKELESDRPLSPSEWGAKYDRLMNSSVYQGVVAPYQKVHAVVFRNALYPWILLLATVLGLVGVVLTRGDAPVFVFVLLALSIFFATLVLHVWVLKFIYYRYTYQVTFFYYLALAMLPPLLSLLRNTMAQRR